MVGSDSRFTRNTATDRGGSDLNAGDCADRKAETLHGAREAVPTGGDPLRRPNGWTSVTNFGDAPIALPTGEVLLRSGGTTDKGQIASESTVWLLAPGSD